MFTNEEVECMKSLGLDLNFDKNLIDDDYEKIESTVSYLLQRHGFDADYNPTAIGVLCENILDKIN